MDTILELLRHFWTDLQNGQLPELGSWNYLLLSLLIVLQGPLATLLGGAAAAAGLLKPGLVLLAGVSGNLTADILWYSVGHAGKKEWILRAGRRFSLGQDHLDKLQAGMHKHAAKILLLAKLSAGLAVPTLVAAGLTRLRWRRWFPVVFLGETLWTGSLLLIGYYATEGIKQIERGVEAVAFSVSSLFLLILVWLLARALRNSKLIEAPASASKTKLSKSQPKKIETS